MCPFARHAKNEVETNSLLCMLSHWLEEPVYIHIKQQQIEAMQCAHNGKDGSFWLPTGLIGQVALSQDLPVACGGWGLATRD